MLAFSLSSKDVFKVGKSLVGGGGGGNGNSNHKNHRRSLDEDTVLVTREELDDLFGREYVDELLEREYYDDLD